MIYRKHWCVAVACFMLTTFSAHAAQSTVPTPCDKELSTADASGILVGAATVNRYSMGETNPANGCELGVADPANNFAMIDIAFNPGSADNLKMLLTMSGRTPKKMPGIGDEAYDLGNTASNIPNATETDVYARKGNTICVVELHRTNGPAGDKLLATTDPGILSSKIGALCQKVFAARP